MLNPKSIVAILKTALPDLQGAYLFGSFASGVYCSAMDFREFRKPHVEETLARGSVYG